MALRVEDGTTSGRWFVVICDGCGATLKAESQEQLDELRYAAGGSVAAGKPDLCADCVKASPALLRRFRG
jgi:hypothetical protein